MLSGQLDLEAVALIECNSPRPGVVRLAAESKAKVVVAEYVG
jgi:hypothetical protein